MANYLDPARGHVSDLSGRPVQGLDILSVALSRGNNTQMGKKDPLQWMSSLHDYFIYTRLDQAIAAVIDLIRA